MDNKLLYLAGVAGVGLFVVYNKYNFSFNSRGFNFSQPNTIKDVLNSKTLASVVSGGAGILKEVVKKKVVK